MIILYAAGFWMLFATLSGLSAMAVGLSLGRAAGRRTARRINAVVQATTGAVLAYLFFKFVAGDADTAETAAVLATWLILTAVLGAVTAARRAGVR